jgi:hypothetical protein
MEGLHEVGGHLLKHKYQIFVLNCFNDVLKCMSMILALLSCVSLHVCSTIISALIYV